MRGKMFVLEADRYDFKGTDGSQVKMAKVSYTDGKPDQSNNHLGVRVMEGSAPHSIFMDLEVLPGFYDVEFELRTKRDSNGKEYPTLYLSSAKLLAAVDLNTDQIGAATR